MMVETLESKLTEEELEALTLMREIVAEKGADYVYPEEEKSSSSCQYLTYDNNGTPTGPSCIVGHYLTRVGVPVTNIRLYEETNAFKVLPALTGHQEDDSRLLWAFSDAQEEQDAGKAWGDALAAFEKRLGL